MKIKTPITKDRLRTHFAYNFWKYLIAIIGSIFAWNLIYTTTAYRSPQDKRVDLYIQSSYVSEDSAKKFIDPIWKASVPDMETVSSVTNLMTGISLKRIVWSVSTSISMCAT